MTDPTIEVGGITRANIAEALELMGGGKTPPPEPYLIHRSDLPVLEAMRNAEAVTGMQEDKPNQPEEA